MNSSTISAEPKVSLEVDSKILKDAPAGLNKSKVKKESETPIADNLEAQDSILVKSNKKNGNEKAPQVKKAKSPKKSVKSSNPKDSAKDKEKKDIVIELEDDMELDVLVKDVKNKEKKKKDKKEKKEKKEKNLTKSSSQYLRGYNPFVFFEKEKFKDAPLKDIAQREYVKEISHIWRGMTDDQKQPYVQMALDYKNTHASDDNNKVLKKKRKRGKSSDSAKEKNEINDNQSQSKKSRKKKNNEKKSKGKKKRDDSSDDKIEIKEDSKKMDIKAILNSDTDPTSYVESILIPFIENSYDYFKNQGIIIPK